VLDCDSKSHGFGFRSRSFHFHLTTLGEFVCARASACVTKLHRPICNLVPIKGGSRHAVLKVTVGRTSHSLTTRHEFSDVGSALTLECRRRPGLGRLLSVSAEPTSAFERTLK